MSDYISKPGKEYEESLISDWSHLPPRFILRAALGFSDFLRRLADCFVPPAAASGLMCMSFIPASWLMMTVQLGIPDLLKNGPKTAEEIAVSIGSPGAAEDIHRVLRMLTAHGYYDAVQKQSQPTRFRNSKKSSTLREDHPNSIKAFTEMLHRETFDCYTIDSLNATLNRKNPGDTAYEHVHGKDMWTVFREQPKREAAFSKAMSSTDAIGLHTVLVDYKWNKFSRMIDIGGAWGTVLAGVMKRNPKIEGVLFDQPQVVKMASQAWTESKELSKLQDRTSMIGGNLFDPATFPPAKDGDVFFLRAILHDWDDDRCIQVLEVLRSVIGTAKATLALGEHALAPEFSGGTLHGVRYLADMTMLAATGGKERTEKQWRDLFDATAFKMTKIYQIRGPQAIVEAVPI